MSHNAQRDLIIEKIKTNFKPIQDALEKAGYTVTFTAYAGRVDYCAGGHASIRSHLREHWGCVIRPHANWQTGVIDRITVNARPARTVTIKYTEKAIPGLLERIAACFNADVAAEAQRKQTNQHAEAWVRQAIKDLKEIKLPTCLIPSWQRDRANKATYLESLHMGMPATPVGRYFPHIDERELAGPNGLSAAQMCYLAECLAKLPSVT